MHVYTVVFNVIMLHSCKDYFALVHGQGVKMMNNMNVVRQSLWYYCHISTVVTLILQSLWYYGNFGTTITLVLQSLWYCSQFGTAVTVVLQSLWFYHYIDTIVILVLRSLYDYSHIGTNILQSYLFSFFDILNQLTCFQM